MHIHAHFSTLILIQNLCQNNSQLRDNNQKEKTGTLKVQEQKYIILILNDPK